MATLLSDIYQAAAQPRLAAVAESLPSENETPMLRFTTAGSVDDGKPTLIGRPAVTPAELTQRYGHGPAVVVSRSAPVLFALQRALFERGVAVAVLQDLPAAASLRDLLANGLIVLSPPGSTAGLEGVAWVQAVAQGSPAQSARAVLRELEWRGVLLSRDVVSPGEGI